jgi:hypothetical protein
MKRITQYISFLKKEYLIWWYDIINIVCIQIDLSLNYNYINLNVLDSGLDINLKLPNIMKSNFDMGKFDSFHLWGNKYFEWQLMYSGYFKTGFKIRWNAHQDHAGLWTEVSFLGITWDMQIYDNRHWDYETNDWCKYPYLYEGNHQTNYRIQGSYYINAEDDRLTQKELDKISKELDEWAYFATSQKIEKLTKNHPIVKELYDDLVRTGQAWRDYLYDCRELLDKEKNDKKNKKAS